MNTKTSRLELIMFWGRHDPDMPKRRSIRRRVTRHKKAKAKGCTCFSMSFESCPYHKGKN